MIKKTLISIIFLFFTFYLYSAGQHEENFFVYYKDVAWAISQQKEELSNLSTEENKNISAHINKNFMNMLVASGFFKVVNPSDLPEAELEKVKETAGYSVSPEITEFEFTESATSGIFLKISIIFPVEKHRKKNEKSITVSAIGWGKNRSEAITNSLNSIVNQFVYVMPLFDELAENFKISDIYQGTVIVNNGKNKGIKKGDFLYSYDYQTGKKTGHFVVERTEEGLSYARILDTKVKPKMGDPLKSDNYIGILSETYADYFLGDEFSGIAAGSMILWTRGLYDFYPFVGVTRFSIVDIADAGNNKMVFITPYLGIRIVRYIKSFSFSADISFGAGFLTESEIPVISPTGWEWNYFGGTFKAEISKRIMKHLFIHVEAGYTVWFPYDYENYPNIAGFIVGGGIGLKF